MCPARYVQQRGMNQRSTWHPSIRRQHLEDLVGRDPSLLACGRQDDSSAVRRRCPDRRVNDRAGGGGSRWSARLQMVGGQHSCAVHGQGGHVARHLWQEHRAMPVGGHKHAYGVVVQTANAGLGQSGSSGEDSPGAAHQHGHPQMLLAA
jgi:hypothetical protein